jgi:hypothetical protein
MKENAKVLSPSVRVEIPNDAEPCIERRLKAQLYAELNEAAVLFDADFLFDLNEIHIERGKSLRVYAIIPQIKKPRWFDSIRQRIRIGIYKCGFAINETNIHINDDR